MDQNLLRRGQDPYNQVAGRGETATGGSRFTYKADWNTDIACCFPVSRREHEWKQGLHPIFQHLGPEGWLRDKQTHVEPFRRAPRGSAIGRWSLF
ncbi:HipA N-terminal domain-containing protein [Bradyrhizobium sp. U531]|uniref:HipA N-terminal domain-containing protein n=1 Tax=Bradyrhizobium sp. U531 TaxID=3053458 RepID=UPI003F432A02